jgi:serine/alanine adding enzyme
VIQFYKNDDGLVWDAYVASSEVSTNYHRYGWRQVVEKSFSHDTYYLVSGDSCSEIRGVLPLVHMKSALFGNFMVSLPFFNYGGILSNDEKTSLALLQEAENLCREIGATHIELRHRAKINGELVSKEHKVAMILDLEKDGESQWKAFDAKVRNQVRKAEKNGLRVVIGHFDLLDGFYEVFCRNMRDLGTPVYGKSFFKNVLETFPDSTRIISIVLKDRTIASGLLTWYRDTLEVPWASSIRDFLELCPNNLLYWEAIKFAIDTGSRKFDFGRSTPDEGTYRFKKQWGANPIPLYWQYLLEKGKPMPELNVKNPKFGKAIRIWQKLPVSFTKILGPHIVRNIP